MSHSCMNFWQCIECLTLYSEERAKTLVFLESCPYCGVEFPSKFQHVRVTVEVIP